MEVWDLNTTPKPTFACNRLAALVRQSQSLQINPKKLLHFKNSYLSDSFPTTTEVVV